MRGHSQNNSSSINNIHRFPMQPETQSLLHKTRASATNNVDIAAPIPDADKKKLSVLPLMVWAQAIFIVYVILRSYQQNVIEFGDAAALIVAPILLTTYALWVMRVGRTKQLFATNPVLSTFPMVWLPLVPVGILMSVFVLRWSAVMAMVESTPPSTLVAFQALRSLAVGSLIKWKHSVFPTFFAWGTAFLDMLFGLSALTLLVSRISLTPNVLFWWNLIGFVIIVPFGVLIVQLGMKPTQLYKSRVSYAVVFEYPMVLGPALVVPTLLCWNALVISWAWSKMDWWNNCLVSDMAPFII